MPIATQTKKVIQKTAPIKAQPVNSQPPQKKNLWILIILSIITLGIYPSIWYIKRSKEFPSLGTEKQLKKGTPIFHLIITILFILTLITMNIVDSPLSSKELNMTQSLFLSAILVTLILNIIMGIFLAFRSRTIINQAWEKKGVQRKLSWLFTLTLNFFYIQYEINRTMENKEMEKRVVPWIALLAIMLPLTLVIFAVIIISILEVTILS